MKKRYLSLIVVFTVLFLLLSLFQLNPTKATGTLYFSSGYENNNFADWTNTESTGGTNDAATIQSTIVHSGHYAANFSTVVNYAFAEETVPNLTTISVREYVNFPVLPADGLFFHVMFLGAPGADLVGIFVRNSGGNYYITDNSNFFVWTPVQISITANTWHCFELDVTGIHTSSGNAKVYYDGVLTNDDTTNLSTITGINIVRIGQYASTTTGIIYSDDVIIGSTYIGLTSYPQYSNLAVSSTVGGSSTILSSYWSSGTVNLANYTIQTNVTGSAVNNTLAFSSISGWANKTLTLPLSGTLQWCIYVNDTEGVWNSTGLQNTVITSVVPQYSNLGYSRNIGGLTSILSSYWTETGASLSKYIVQTNVTGFAVNGTATSFSATPSWVNTTVTMPSFGTLQWAMYANDTNNLWTYTGLQNITISPVFNITSSIMNGTRFNPSSSITITGIVQYNYTSTNVLSGVTVFANQTFNMAYNLGYTSSLNSTGGFTIIGSLPSTVNSYNYTIYTSGICGQTKTLLPIVDKLTITMNANTTNPTAGYNVGINIGAVYAYDSTPLPWATLKFSVNRNSTYLTQTNFTDTLGVAGRYIYSINNANDTTYNLNSFTSNALTIIWSQPAASPTIEIFQIYQNTTRTGINENAYISYEVRYSNGTLTPTGTLTINNSAVNVNSGWGNFTVSTSNIGLATYILSAVNCSGTTIFSQIPSNPQVIFDNLQITFYTSNSVPQDSESVAVSWVVLHQYDSQPVSSFVMNITRDSLPFVNNTALTYTTDSDSETVHSYSTSAIVDSTHPDIHSFTTIPVTTTWHTISASTPPPGGGGGNNFNPTSTPVYTGNSIPTSNPDQTTDLSQGAIWGIVIIIIILVVATVAQQTSNKRKSAGYTLKKQGGKIWQA